MQADGALVIALRKGTVRKAPADAAGFSFVHVPEGLEDRQRGGHVLQENGQLAIALLEIRWQSSRADVGSAKEALLTWRKLVFDGGEIGVGQ